MAMVEPLGADAPFFVGVEETVTRTESIRFVTGAMRWRETHALSGAILSFVGSDGLVVIAQLREVVYVLNPSSSAVSVVVMVFHAALRRVAVCVSPETFAARLAYTASTKGVLVSTVPRDASLVPPASLKSTFPNASVSWDVTTSAPLANSSVAKELPRVAVVAGELTLLLSGNLQAGKAYFGKNLAAPPDLARDLNQILKETVASMVEPRVSMLEQFKATVSSTFGIPALSPQGSAIVTAGSDQKSIIVTGLSDQALNGIYEAADPPTTPLEWRLVPASANQAKIYLAAPLAMVLEVTKDDGTKSRNIAFKVTDGAPATLEVSSRSTTDPGGEPLATATFGKSACEGYWTKEWPSCTGSGDAACDTIAACATAGTGASTSTLLYSGTSIALAPLKGAAGALYGTTSDYVIYVVKPGPGSAASAASAASTAKVIRKGSGQAELLDASLVDKEWVVDAKVDASVVLGPYATAVPVVPVAPAECADLRSCLKRTPLDLSKCGVQAAACKGQPKVASGAKLEHGDKKVDLLTLGLADERALFGSDDRGVFVVSVSKDDANKGKRLFVATDGKASVVDVEYDKDKTTWREVSGMNWVLIGCAIGGGVLALILLAVVVYYVASSGGSQQTVVSYAPPFPPVSPFPPM